MLRATFLRLSNKHKLEVFAYIDIIRWWGFYLQFRKVKVDGFLISKIDRKGILL